MLEEILRDRYQDYDVEIKFEPPPWGKPEPVVYVSRKCTVQRLWPYIIIEFSEELITATMVGLSVMSLREHAPKIRTSILDEQFLEKLDNFIRVNL